ncbi:MAG: methionine--tRNA ligase [Phycisphaeraceae bacterium]|nr:methionine--tRNA ligase [Phycisphaeraceae bacterium]
MSTGKFYVTTPIYYVNDRPHIGHVYTTTIADILARYHRLAGDDVFFLTGTDEHATKVVDSAAAHNTTPLAWADRNAAAFEETFAKLGISNDDFIRTTQPRHKERVQRYVQRLMDSGDVYLGQYEGWYDAGQEEYLTETAAAAAGFKSPINGKPLVRKKEDNYFFKLSRYQQPLLDLYEKQPGFVRPEARKNEIVNRIRDGLNDVPISRTGSNGWGITVPGDDKHTIYVWIDALFNYYSTVDTPQRQKYWPADVHLIAKDILWFHAAIWPAMLLALNIDLPGSIYSHSFWISEGQKMSKSLGNFIDLEKIDRYVTTFGLDALRYFLASNGPLGTTDSDFAEAKFIEVYNTDLANTLGNCFSRVTNMTNRYFGGKLPAKGQSVAASAAYAHQAEQSVADWTKAFGGVQLNEAITAALDLVRAIDNYIEQTAPFKLAKDPARLPEVGTILYNCAEALRIASLLLWPVIPGKVEELWRRIGCGHYADALADKGRGQLAQWTQWGVLQPGTPITAGDPLFPRYQPPKV